MTGLDNYDPADELRKDIESAIAAQEKAGEPPPESIESEPAEASTGEEASSEPATPERDEKGRFKAKSEEESAEPTEKPVQAKVEPVVAVEPAKSDARPPPGFSVASKAAWDNLPQSVRDDIAKREHEIDSGFKRYSGLGKFAEEAERNGTTLRNAITDYASIETALKQDFINGLEFICQRLGVDPRLVANHMATRYGLAQPTGAAQTPAQNQAQAPSFDVNAMNRQFQQIARTEAERVAQAMRAESERAQIDAQIAEFAANPKNKFFANVRQDMAALVQAGKVNTLQEAYDAAQWLNPEIRAVLINGTTGGRDKEAAAAASKARNAAKAVGGSPAPGVNPDTKSQRRDLSLEDEIRSAIDAQVGQI